MSKFTKPVTLLFDIYSEHEKIGRCEIINGKLIKNDVYISGLRALIEHPFPNCKDFFSVSFLLEERVLPECRCDSVILNSMGLTEYNMYDIIRANHGVTDMDYTWFKFDDDPKDLCWEDVRFPR